MRMLLLTAMLLVITLGAGCASNAAFVGAVDGYTQVVLPEYREYVKNDAKLDEETKRIRLQTAERFQKLVDEAKPR